MAADKNIDSNNKPHDTFFKQMMHYKKVRDEVLQSYLPLALQDIINWQKLQYEPTNFQTDYSKELIADMVFKTKIANSDAYIAILVEHQSQPDKLMPFRILQYTCEVINHHLKSKEDDKDKRVPLVYPLVIYHGKKPYNYSNDICDLVNAPKVLVQKYFLKPCKLIDLTKIKDQELKSKLWASAMTMALKHVFDRDIIPRLKDIFCITTETFNKGETQLSAIVVEYILKNADTPSSDQVNRIIEGIESKAFGEKVMTIAERLEAKGRAEGKAEGATEAAQKIARNMLNEGVEPQFVAKLTGLSLQQVAALQAELETV